jgi:cytochrome c-type biogenesis protein CcmH
MERRGRYPRTMKAFVPIVLALPLWLACDPGSPSDAGGTRASELAVQSRIVAPCCWNQTLENHASPLADALRAEIHTRIAAGEAGQRIEDDLATRYGERVRAMPRSREPRSSLAAVVVGAMALSLLALVRWGRLQRASAPARCAPSDEDTTYDAALAEELARRD